MEECPLNRYIVWYVNYISSKLLQKTKDTKAWSTAVLLVLFKAEVDCCFIP